MTPPTQVKTKPQYRAWWQWLSDRTPHIYAVSFLFLSAIVLRQPLTSLVNLSLRDELASHVLVIPFISGILIYMGRERIFSSPRFCPAVGLPLLVLAVALGIGLQSRVANLSPSDHLSVIMALIVTGWIGAFILFYGATAFRAAAFPLLFLFLMSPLPVVVSANLISLLQRGSAGVCYGLFHLIGVPVTRSGFRFALPGIEIEVAEQCSGIHAGLSLFIAGLLAEHVLLGSLWKKACFTLFIFPIAIFKNAVRIVTIAWLGIHVSPNYFHGPLHRQGGLPFSLLALALMAALLWLLRRPERLSMVRPPS